LPSALHRPPRQVEIALADGDVETARSAAAELSEIATRYARPALAAAAECAQATVLSAEGDPAMAAASLRRGIALWREAGAPYETARARLLPGKRWNGTAIAGTRWWSSTPPGRHSSHWERSSISNARHGSTPRPEPGGRRRMGSGGVCSSVPEMRSS
jgi:hypothetical protein